MIPYMIHYNIDYKKLSKNSDRTYQKLSKNSDKTNIWKEYANKYCSKSYYCKPMKVGEAELSMKMKTDCIHYKGTSCEIVTRRNNCKNCKYYVKRIYKKDCIFFDGCQKYYNSCNECEHYEIL